MTKFHPQEDDTTEFKLILTDKFEKEVVAFLNSEKGGDIYIGVADDGKIKGVENAQEEKINRPVMDPHAGQRGAPSGGGNH